MSLACPTAENNCLAETASSLRCIFNSLRPDATAPDDMTIISTPALCSLAIWSVRADMRVMSSVPSGRARTLLPIFTVIRLRL